VPKKTLDVEHSQILEQVRKRQDARKDLENSRSDVLKKINKLKTVPRNAWSEADFDEFVALTDALVGIERCLEDGDGSSCENEYYLRTASILYDYYDIIEGKDRLQQASKEASEIPLTYISGRCGGALEDATTKQHLTPTNTSYSTYDVLLAKRQERLETPEILRYLSNVTHPPSYDTPQHQDAAASKSKPQETKLRDVNRALLLDRYMASAFTSGPLRHIISGHSSPETAAPDSNGVDAATMSRAQTGSPHNTIHDVSGDGYCLQNTCSHCGDCNITVLLQEGCIVCNSCHTLEYILVDHEKPSYKDPPKEAAYFAYKRINHLNEWLNQVQGKETTEIPEDVFISIILEIKKQKITNMATLTRKKVKEILKKLKINKYYEHVPHIIHRLNGIPPPNMTPELEDKIRYMFCMIQVPFLKYSPATRKNFLSYSYCLHKMMQLLEKDQYLDRFPLLKSREKLHQQDQIWRKICEDIGWDFIPSL